METIDRDSKRSTDCMLDLVTRWFSEEEGTGDLPRTWETVVKAVKFSGRKKLAEELARKFEVTIPW